MWEYLFPRPKTAREMLQENERKIRKGVNEIERARKRLEREENTIKRDIKKEAEKGNMRCAKLHVKNLVRCRNANDKFVEMQMQLKTIGINLKTISSTTLMTEVMRETARLMQRMNRQYKLPQMAKVMMVMELQSEEMESKQEIMDDTINSMNETDDTEERENEIMTKIFEEIGITVVEEMGDIKIKNDRKDGLDDKLLDRLTALKK